MARPWKHFSAAHERTEPSRAEVRRRKDGSSGEAQSGPDRGSAHEEQKQPLRVWVSVCVCVCMSVCVCVWTRSSDPTDSCSTQQSPAGARTQDMREAAGARKDAPKKKKKKSTVSL